jgi:hypothetical protein
MARHAYLAALLLAACGGSADAPELTEADDAPPVSEARPSPRAEVPPPPRLTAPPEPAISEPPPTLAEPEPALGDDDDPPPTVTEPPLQPVSEPPPPVVMLPPAPTAEDPLIIDCADDGCSACWAELRVEHPDWYDSGAAACQWRECSDASECADLGAALICGATGGPSGPTGKMVCRSARTPLYGACGGTGSEHDATCEVGLWCVKRPLRPGEYWCKEFSG